MIRRPPRSRLDRSSAASDVYKRQPFELVERRFVGSRGALWRHHASMELAQNFFPGLRLIGHAIQAQSIERQTGGSKTLVVAGDAILVQHGARFGGRTALLEGESSRKDGENPACSEE